MRKQCGDNDTRKLFRHFFLEQRLFLRQCKTKWKKGLYYSALPPRLSSPNWSLEDLKVQSLCGSVRRWKLVSDSSMKTFLQMSMLLLDQDTPHSQFFSPDSRIKEQLFCNFQYVGFQDLKCMKPHLSLGNPIGKLRNGRIIVRFRSITSQSLKQF